MAGRLLRIRLPDDHWVWSIPENERSVKVRHALEFYQGTADSMEGLKQEMKKLHNEFKNIHVEKKIKHREKDSQETESDGNSTKERLAASRDKWLEF